MPLQTPPAGKFQRSCEECAKPLIASWKSLYWLSTARVGNVECSRPKAWPISCAQSASLVQPPPVPPV